MRFTCYIFMTIKYLDVIFLLLGVQSGIKVEFVYGSFVLRIWINMSYKWVRYFYYCVPCQLIQVLNDNAENVSIWWRRHGANKTAYVVYGKASSRTHILFNVSFI